MRSATSTRTSFALASLLVAALVSPAGAASLDDQKPVRLTLSVEQTMLVVQTLGQIGCQKVADMATCDLARETLKAIQEQAKQQGN